MAILDILHYPDPRLHTVAKPVAQIDGRIRQLVKDMAQTMYDAPGIGLAATQINVHERVIVIDLSEEQNRLLVLINPEITWRSDEMNSHEEGCLSVPGVFESVKRSAQIKVKALDENGKEQIIEADDLLSVCIQHEMDHLAGKVFVEKLSMLKQSRIKTKLHKAKREPVAV